MGGGLLSAWGMVSSCKGMYNVIGLDYEKTGGVEEQGWGVIVYRGRLLKGLSMVCGCTRT